MNLLSLKNARKNYGGTHALNGMSIEVSEGEMVAVMGRSGCGKSTLLNVLSGLDVMDSGAYYYRDQPLDCSDRMRMAEFRNKKIGIVLQNFALINDLSVFENVALPLRYAKMKAADIKKTVESLLKKLDISDKADKLPNEMSGGECQRAAIARALVKGPGILLCDEPTGSLDEANSENIMDIFSVLHQNGQTIVLVTHETQIAAKCQRIVRMRDGAQVKQEGAYV